MVRTDDDESAARRASRCGSEYKLSGERRKRVPRTTPDAPRVRRDAICEPAANPPAASSGGPCSWEATLASKGKRDKRGRLALSPWPPASFPVSQVKRQVRETVLINFK